MLRFDMKPGYMSLQPLMDHINIGHYEGNKALDVRYAERDLYRGCGTATNHRFSFPHPAPVVSCFGGAGVTVETWPLL